MGQFSMEISCATGSVLSGNQHAEFVRPGHVGIRFGSKHQDVLGWLICGAPDSIETAFNDAPQESRLREDGRLSDHQLVGMAGLYCNDAGASFTHRAENLPFDQKSAFAKGAPEALGECWFVEQLLIVRAMQ